MAFSGCVGIIGWRGMVGNTLVRRLLGLKASYKLVFFSTSGNVLGAQMLGKCYTIRSPERLELMLKCSLVVISQGSHQTATTVRLLRKLNWRGFWVDAASFLRSKPNALVVLDPVNHSVLLDGFEGGIKSFVGGNCTVSLLLMGVSGVVLTGEASQLQITTFQSVSGAGISAVRNLLEHARQFSNTTVEDVLDGTASFISQATSSYSVMPWIDNSTKKVGTSREELKGAQELRKMTCRLVRKIPVSSICVRVNVIRCHSQCVTLRTTAPLNLNSITDAFQSFGCWVKVVPNKKASSEQFLTPNAVSGSFVIKVGRIKRITVNRIVLFTVGDQLLWGAAEPLVRLYQALVSIS